MANYIVSDTDLTSVADAIRAKGNTSAPLVFPDGFSDAITNISASSTPKYTTATITPNESTQYATPPDGYDALTRVTVNPISSTYVGSGVAKKSSTDLTASGATVTVPAGYYASQTTKSVGTVTLATPSASKGTVSNNQVSITPSIDQSSGYVTGATKSGTPVTVSASELVSGNKLITSNGTNIDVTNYKTVTVDVPTSSGGSDTATGYIDRKQDNPPSSATSQTFTGMKGEPNWFVYTIAASSLSTASGYSRCVNVIYDGTNLVGSALGTSGTYSDSYFTKSYSGNSLTVGTTGTTTGGYVHNSSASEGYKLLYGYGGANVNKRYVNESGDSVSFTGINKKPDWFCIYAIQDYTVSASSVVDVVYDGHNIYGNYTESNSVKHAVDFSYTYSGTTLTINSNSGSSFLLDDDGYCLIYGYANETEDSDGGGSSSSDFYSGTFNGTGTKGDQVEINCGFQPTGFTIVSNTSMSASNNISMVSATKVGTTTYTGCVGYRGSYGSTITTSAFVNASIPTTQVTVTFEESSLVIAPGTNYAFQKSAYTVHAWK